jgi:fatty acid synthase subunit beta
VLNYLHAHVPLPELPEQIVSLAQAQIEQVALANPPTTLTRGCATIPLRGIDVPFHSSSLLPGVAGFRRCLLNLIDGHSLDPKCLVGRYIPNLTAQPFELSKEYFELVHRTTGSVALGGVLREVILFVLLCIAEGMVANHDLVGYIS